MTDYLYVPILKWKQGEQGAIKFLEDSTKDRIIPLFEIGPDINYSKFSSTLSNWNNRLFYFDLLEECYDEYDGSLYFDLLKQCDANYVIPVLNLEDDENVIKHTLSLTNCGICFRINSNDFETDKKNTLIKLANSLDLVDVQRTDIIIDFKSIDCQKNMTLESIIHSITKKFTPRRLIIAASTFPQSLSKCKQGEICLITRSEWEMFSSFYDENCNDFICPIIFADYGISHPSYFEYVVGMSPSFNIRYSDETHYVIVKGAQIKKGGLESDNVISLCEKLKSSKHFKGANYSWGDEYIATRVRGANSFGNLTTWRKVGTNHHISLVVNQLSNLLDV